MLKKACFVIVISMISIVARGQFVSVSGIVKDSLTQKPIYNVNVYESSTKTGTFTDKKGYYHLLLKEGKADVSFNYKKYQSQTLQFDLKKNIKQNIVLQLDQKSEQNKAQPATNSSTVKL